MVINKLDLIIYIMRVSLSIFEMNSYTYLFIYIQSTGSCIYMFVSTNTHTYIFVDKEGHIMTTRIFSCPISNSCS